MLWGIRSKATPFDFPIFPEGLQSHVSFSAFRTPEWMKSFLENFAQDIEEFESVVNMGTGMILAVAKEEKEAFEKESQSLSLDPYLIGEIS